MQAINHFNPINSSSSILPNQEFTIHSYTQPAVTQIKTKGQGYIKVTDLELLLIKNLPNYYFTGTLEDGGELSIQYDRKIYHIHLFDEDKLYYRYSTDDRDIWLLVLLTDLLDLFPFNLFASLWYYCGFLVEEKGTYIGQDIQKIIESNDIHLESYMKK